MWSAQGNTKGFRTGHRPIKILDEDVIIPTGLHLGEMYFLPPWAHMGDIHQLCVFIGEAAFDDLRQGSGGIYAGKAWDAQLHGASVEQDIIAYCGVFDGSGVDDVVDFPLLKQVHQLIAFGGIWYCGYRDAQLFDCLCCAGSCV